MKNIHRLLAVAALGLPAFAMAGASDYVHLPSVEYGEREIDLKYGTEKMKDSEGGERTSDGSVGFGYGATTWWFTEAYVKWKKEGGEKTKYDAFEWENKFQLTELNKYPVDVGFFIEIERPQERAEGHEPVVAGRDLDGQPAGEVTRGVEMGQDRLLDARKPTLVLQPQFLRMPSRRQIDNAPGHISVD